MFGLGIVEAEGVRFPIPAEMLQRPPAVEPNHLNSQTLVHYFEQDWRNVVR